MNRTKLLLGGVSLLLCLSLAVSGTFAWLKRDQPADDAYPVLGDFQVEGLLTFEGQTEGVIYSGDSVLIPLSLDPNGENYIGNMKYVVRYTGVSPAYIRVRVLEQWVTTSTNEIMPSSFLKYAVPADGSPTAILPDSPDAAHTTIPAVGPGADSDVLAQTGAWVDHRDVDYCYYYSVPVQPKQLTTPKEGDVKLEEGTVLLTLFAQTPDNTADMIAGLTPGQTQLTLLIEVEAVQPNRFREFWNIESIPTP